MSLKCVAGMKEGYIQLASGPVGGWNNGGVGRFGYRVALGHRCFFETLSSLLSFPANPLAQQLLGRLARRGRQ